MTIYLPPTETVKVWEERAALRPTVNWREMMNEEHASAFTVAKIAKLELLVSVRQSLDEVIRNGGTFEQWKASILPELQKAGWWGVVNDPALTGTTDTIVVNDRRLRNIYRTNIRMSIAAGRWRKFQAEKHLFPYLRYLSDHYRKHPRLNHQAWHGIILPVDHPAWQWLFPPNGWGCNCKVEQVSERRMLEKGWKVSEPPKVKFSPFASPSGPIMVPDGVAPGFGYNPGTAHLRVLADRLTASIEKSLAHGLDDVAAASLRQLIDDPAFDQFMAMPDGAFPVAIMSDDQARLIGATRRTVVLRPRVVRKQVGQSPAGQVGHPDLTIDDYRLLPGIVDEPIIMLRQDAIRIIYFADRREPDRLWKAVIRQDDDETNPVLVSFQRTDVREARREAGKTAETETLLDLRDLL